VSRSSTETVSWYGRPSAGSVADHVTRSDSPGATQCPSSWSPQALGIPLIFLFGALHLLKQRREKEDVAKLTEERDDLADQKSGLEDRLAVAQGVVTSLLDLFALTLAHGLSLGTQGRASIFLTQADGESCLLVGRFSDNPTYKRPSRSSYSLTQGCMGRAWTDSELEALDMPDTASTVTEWVNYQAKAYGMPKEEAKALPMKSRSYAGVRVDDSKHMASSRTTSTRGLRWLNTPENKEGPADADREGVRDVMERAPLQLPARIRVRP